MERVERTNTIMVNQQSEFVLRYDLYAIDVNRERNCYSCEGFGHLERNCRNREIVGRGRQLKYRNNQNASNLNEEENLIVLN